MRSQHHASPIKGEDRLLHAYSNNILYIYRPRDSVDDTALLDVSVIVHVTNVLVGDVVNVWHISGHNAAVIDPTVQHAVIRDSLGSDSTISAKENSKAPLNTNDVSVDCLPNVWLKRSPTNVV